MAESEPQTAMVDKEPQTTDEVTAISAPTENNPASLIAEMQATIRAMRRAMHKKRAKLAGLKEKKRMLESMIELRCPATNEPNSGPPAPNDSNSGPPASKPNPPPAKKLKSRAKREGSMKS